MNNIEADHLELGKNVVIEPTARIRGISGKAKRVKIGDNCYIGDSVQIICDDFSLGDYSKIQHHTNVHGYKPCSIGHNAWIGQYTIIDSIGGTTIGNNCGIGAHSQLWSHIKYGDTLEGCNFLGESPLTVGHDVWFVGHCIVSPITAEDKSMALVGSVVTRNMKYNEIYAGSPAASLSAKIGYQFKEVTVEEKLAKMAAYVQQAGVDADLIRIVATEKDIQPDGRIYFAVKERTYTKTRHPEEVKFMKFLLPEKAKFVPVQ
ncbi:acyltransferase [Ohtaekwangia sp.]|uniref:acyltransferase n=1 Tax=Ohtaekwangia sp. TaxID=2066019 RepID=UPI002F93B2F2